ncbi:MAG: 50S ribosomal protein L25/general stress protein Ctc [Prevotellaceae bacterium]|nr:50S ribosomal protein L25/general stress protein Ctc [Candidatus Faecinaster equi]
MKVFELKGTKRATTGKKASRECRKSGNIPCVLYGASRDAEGKVITTEFEVKFEDVRKLIYTPDIFSINLTVDGETCKAVMRELQFHPVKDNVLHIDFYQITEGQPISMDVPVVFEGHAKGVREGGALYTLIRRLKVKALYDVIPEKLHIDVTELGINKSIKVGDLSFEGLELLTPKQTLVCTVKATRASMSAASKEEGEA